MENNIKELVYENPRKLSKCVIEINGNCNFKCDHCYICSKNKMSFDLFKKAVDELYELECLFLLITGGECLLHPDFKKMFLYAKNKGFLVGINTNGYYLNNDMVNFLAQNKPYIIEISLYGYDELSYEKFTHVSDAFVTINSNVDYAKKKGLTINFKTPLTKRNYKYLDKLKDYSNKKNILYRYDYIIFPKLDSSNHCEERLETSQIVDLIKNDSASIKHFIDKYNMHKKYEYNNKHVFQCTAGEDAIYIDCDGFINMCIVVSNQKYNINKCSIKDAMKYFLDFKNSEYSGNEKCYSCNKKSICRYCPGRFYLETGDYKINSDWYCDFSDKIINYIENSYIVVNKNSSEITSFELDKMYAILIKNLKTIFNDFIEKSDDKLLWQNSIKNSDYKFILVYDSGQLVAYLEYYNKDGICYLSDIEIDDSHKGDKKTFKQLLKSFYINIEPNQSIYCNINKENKKSLNVFKHIGLKKLMKKNIK